MFSLSQHEPSDFELETPVVITDTFVAESLRTLKLVRTNPNVAIYVRRHGNLAARLTEFVEVLRGYKNSNLRPYHSFYWGNKYQKASTTYKQMRRYVEVDQIRRQVTRAFEDIDAYRLVMGYGLWFDASHLDAIVATISETPIRAVLLRHSEHKYLLVF